MDSRRLKETTVREVIRFKCHEHVKTMSRDVKILSRDFMYVYIGFNLFIMFVILNLFHMKYMYMKERIIIIKNMI